MWMHLYLKMDSFMKCFLFSNVFQMYFCVGLSTLTELYCRYTLHSIRCFLNFAYHIYPTAHQKETTTKCHVEVVIIYTI